jgi:hypothetical protein
MTEFWRKLLSLFFLFGSSGTYLYPISRVGACFVGREAATALGLTRSRPFLRLDLSHPDWFTIRRPALWLPTETQKPLFHTPYFFHRWATEHQSNIGIDPLFFFFFNLFSSFSCLYFIRGKKTKKNTKVWAFLVN